MVIVIDKYGNIWYSKGTEEMRHKKVESNPSKLDYKESRRKEQ